MPQKARAGFCGMGSLKERPYEDSGNGKRWYAVLLLCLFTVVFQSYKHMMDIVDINDIFAGSRKNKKCGPGKIWQPGA